MNDFLNLIQLIKRACTRALSAVNSELVNLYWQVGQYVSIRLEESTWGNGMVAELAQYIQKHHPEIKGFDKKNLYRMCGFYEAYKDSSIVAPAVRQLQRHDNERDKIVLTLVPQLEQFDENTLIDIRNTVLAQISWSPSFNTGESLQNPLRAGVLHPALHQGVLQQKGIRPSNQRLG